ncbi:MAG: metallophosphoesterase [Clostridiales bacterium]|nr:metallophosphoesterase [Clostridiales bacterium]
MRILVVSDTHRNEAALRRAILSQPKAEIVIHLGDGEEEAELMKAYFPKKKFFQVCGNCDWGSTLPATGELTAEGKRIFYTHGHIYNVKYGLGEIVAAARAHKADILLFGHTHEPLCEYEAGLYILNPGSLRGFGGTYGIVDITPAGIVTNVVNFN